MSRTKFITTPGEVEVYDFELDRTVHFECPDALNLSISADFAEKFCQLQRNDVVRLNETTTLTFENQDDVMEGVAALYAAGEKDASNLQSDGYYHRGYNTAPAVNTNEEWYFAGDDGNSLGGAAAQTQQVPTDKKGYKSFAATVLAKDSQGNTISTITCQVMYTTTQWQEVDPDDSLAGTNQWRVYSFPGTSNNLDTSNIERTDDNTDDEIAATENLADFDHWEVSEVRTADGETITGVVDIRNWFQVEGHADGEWASTPTADLSGDALAGIRVIDNELGLVRVVILATSDNNDGSTTEFDPRKYDPFQDYRIWDKEATINDRPSSEIANVYSLHYRWGGDVIDTDDQDILSTRTEIPVVYQDESRQVAVKVIMDPVGPGKLIMRAHDAEILPNGELNFQDEQLMTSPVNIRIFGDIILEKNLPDSGDTVTVT